MPDAFSINIPDWRRFFFQHIRDIVTSAGDDKLRLAASLGGLRALAHIEALSHRADRLAQQGRMIDLAREHLALQQRREDRLALDAQHRRELDNQLDESDEPDHDDESAADDTDDADQTDELDEADQAADARRVGGDSLSDSEPSTPLPPKRPSNAPNPPLTPDELADLEANYPKIPPLNFRMSAIANHRRDMIDADRARGRIPPRNEPQSSASGPPSNEPRALASGPTTADAAHSNTASHPAPSPASEPAAHDATTTQPAGP